MPLKPPPSNRAPHDLMELPQAVIAQAEAAAAAETQREDERPTSQAAPGASTGKDGKTSSSAERRVGIQFPESNRPKTDKDRPSAPQEPPIEQIPTIAYGPELGQVDFNQDGFNTQAKVADDGRLNIDINQKSRRLSDLLVPALRSQLNIQQVKQPADHPPGYIPPALHGISGQVPPPPMNVVIHVVGSRGDVQPFVALGKVLKEEYGHRVRLATHATFRGFIEENGLEFFSIGGDPAELMAFMVKNPGLMPGMDSLRSGDVGKRRKGMYEIVQGCWRSCIEIGDGTGIRASDDHLDSHMSLDSGIGMDIDPREKPFVADCIIANPPSFAHVHIAEKMGIPLHLMFTMPWSPTQSFPHPLANIQSSNADANITNFVSYALVEMMTWQGLGDVINRFREKSLNLEPVSLMWAPGMAARLRIPYTYCWSPALIPKPKDWGSHISISGFYFLSLASTFTPERDLVDFLDAGPPPVYIGFGSIVVDDPNAMTKLIFDAVKKSGQRALVSKGWGGFGGDELGVPDGIFMLGNVPHDWLFQHVSCVVHHGGAGTTAAGIMAGKPTVVVPFFGDQPFWGAMIAKAGAGPSPIPNKQLTAEKLAAAIAECLKPTTQDRAKELGARMASENGTHSGANSFHEKLDIDTMRCLLAPSRVAVWRVKRTTIRLSAFAATVLGNEGLLDFKNLKLYRPREYDSEDGPWDPITGGASALMGTIGSLAMGFADFPVEIIRALKVKSSDKSADRDSIPSLGESSSRPATASKSSLDLERGGTTESQITAETTDPLSSPSSPRGSREEPKSPGVQRSASGQIIHQNSMRSALRETLSKSSSRSSSPSRKSEHHHRSLSGDRASQISLEAALGAGKSVKQIVGAGLKSPMDFTLSLARGFHNAPKLYGDESVRPADKVTGFQSGLKVAGKEFGFGLYDGITGLVTQPLDGAKKEGVAGLIKGFGKGIGGVVLKPGAAFWGLPGYTFKGIYKELQNHLGSSVQNYIVAARTAQGYEDWHDSNREERLDVVSRWQAIQVEIEKEKQLARHGKFFGHHCYLKATVEERKRVSAAKKKRKKGLQTPDSDDNPAIIPTDHPFITQPQKPKAGVPSPDSADFEEAVQTAVAATSRGVSKEDELIERAIRASVIELQKAQKNGNTGDAVQGAIQAAIAEAGRIRSGERAKPIADNFDGAGVHDEQLQAALLRSMHEPSESNPRMNLAAVGFDDSGIDTDDDENIKTAIERSKSMSIADPPVESPQDEDFQNAIELSKKVQQEHQQTLSESITEEAIVLEYIKKQSWAEEEHRKTVAAKET